MPNPRCAYCNTPIIGKPEHSTHRDGWGQGPEVPLCGKCGGPDLPMETIWEKTSKRAELLRERSVALQQLCNLMARLAPDTDIDSYEKALREEAGYLLAWARALREELEHRVGKP